MFAIYYCHFYVDSGIWMVEYWSISDVVWMMVITDLAGEISDSVKDVRSVS